MSAPAGSSVKYTADYRHANPAAALGLLWARREVLWAWIRREVSVRYRQTFLGVLWAVLQPLALMIVFSAIFTQVLPVETEGAPYTVFAYTGLLFWSLFANAVSYGSQSIVNNLNLVTKVYFPREILPLSAIATSLLDFGFAALVFLGLIAVYGLGVSWSWLLLPYLLAVELLLIIGLVLVLAALNVFYRDIRFVVPVGLQLLFYATPLVYPLELVPAWLKTLLLLNPLAGLVESARQALLFGRPPPAPYLLVPTAISVAVFFLGLHWFKRVEMRFADEI
ncbi:MAG: ABC transporter permease [Candidatus Promineifilaceae bacterium]